MISIVLAAVVAVMATIAGAGTNYVHDSAIWDHITDRLDRDIAMMATNASCLLLDPTTMIHMTLHDDSTLEVDYADSNTVTTVLSTNVVETDNARPMPMIQISCCVMGCTEDHTDYGDPATERTVTTTVIATDTLHLKWDGKPATVTRERVLSTTVKRYKKRDEWEEVKP